LGTVPCAWKDDGDIVTVDTKLYYDTYFGIKRLDVARGYAVCWHSHKDVAYGHGGEYETTHPRTALDFLYQRMITARVDLWQVLFPSDGTLLISQINDWNHPVIFTGTRNEVYHMLEPHIHMMRERE